VKKKKKKGNQLRMHKQNGETKEDVVDFTTLFILT
jgi:hypothetical protein